MKIALICPSSLPCPPIRSGAIELLIDRISPHLVHLNNQVVVFSIQDQLLPNLEKKNGVVFVRFPKESYFKEVLSHLKNEFFDLIQVFNTPPWIQAVRRASPKSHLVLSLHNLRLGHSTDDEKSIQIVKTADHLVTVSRFIAKDIISRYPEASGKTTVLYTGEDPSRYIPHDSHEGQKIKKLLRSKFGIPNDYTILLYVGRLVRYKGCHHLIQAMKEVQEQYPNTALVIVGSKWFGDVTKSPYIEKLMEDAAKVDHIYFTQFIPVNEIPALYSMSDIFVCPSQWEEPLARVHYEAMAAALPIITTNRGGNTEVIEHGKNGWVIEQYDQPAAFSKAIVHLLQNPALCEKMGRVNRSLIESKLNFREYSLHLFELYEQLLEKKKG